MSGRSTREHATRLLQAAGETLCLELANTVAWRGTAQPEERLASPKDLLDWCVRHNALGDDDVAALRTRWRERPGEALACYRDALTFREAIDRACRSVIRGDQTAEADLRILNEMLGRAPARTRIAQQGGAAGWIAGSGRAGCADLLAPIAWSAADLLAGPHLERLRSCANERCGWLFLDASRGGTRRWCSMQECGNQAKARRHYLRTRSENPAQEPD